MTVRALVFGLIGAMIIAGFAYINDWILKMASLLAGHLVPVAVLMFILLGGLAVLVLRLFGRKDRIKPGELAVAMTLMMVGCSIPVSGLMETFGPSLVLPMHYAKQMPGWKKHDILQYTPPSMLPGDAKWKDPDVQEKVVHGFLGRMGEEGKPIPLNAVPWGYWRRCLSTWMPLVVLAAIAMTCMGLIVHRQWSQRERLRYPIAEVATSLLSGRTADNKPLFRNRVFWTGFIIVFAIHLMNGYYNWNSNSIRIPLQYSFDQILTKWPALNKAEWGPDLTRPLINFTAIAFSFFLASDIGLSLGISQLAYAPLSAILITAGINIRSDYMSGGLSAYQRFGSFMAFALMLLYVGRKYYWHLLLRAFTFTKQEGVAGYEAWAARILFLVVIAMVVIISTLGLSPVMAVMVVGMVLVIYLTVSRISAETGLFFIQPRWQPLGVMLGLFGSFALGPEAIIIVGLICIVLCFDPSQSLMPYFTNALRACDRLGVKMGRIGWTTVATYALCLALAVTVVLWASYNWPLMKWRFFTESIPKASFQAADKAVTQLENSGQLQQSLGLTGWQRLLRIDPDSSFLWGAGAGLVAVLVLSSLRLRFTWWPLHPVFLLVWGTWPMVRLSPSFFIGWFIKSLVTRLGGNAAYQASKPLMIGVIAGDLLGAGIWMLYGAIYYAKFNQTPSSYWVFPH